MVEIPSDVFWFEVYLFAFVINECGVDETRSNDVDRFCFVRRCCRCCCSDDDIVVGRIRHVRALVLARVVLLLRAQDC